MTQTIKPLFTINDWSLLSCQPHSLGTHQEPEEPLSKHRIRIQKRTFGEGWVLTTLAKALEWCCCSHCLFWDCPGMLSSREYVKCPRHWQLTHTQPARLVHQIKERKHLLERKHRVSPPAILHLCWLLIAISQPPGWVAPSCHPLATGLPETLSAG